MPHLVPACIKLGAILAPEEGSPKNFTVHGEKDLRFLPAYSVAEASRYLLIPRATLSSWVAGRPYPTQSGRRLFRPVVPLPDRHRRELSFVNLVEAHVLGAIRGEHHIPLDKIRIAIDYLRNQFGSAHPLADHQFETNGIDLFVQKYGQLINITRAGQTAMRELLQCFLQRVEYQSGVAVKLYPFTQRPAPEAPRSVVIDPRLSFGRPVLSGTGIATAIIAERYKAGESVAALAGDYSRDRLEIEEAIRCELQLEAA